MRLNRRQLLAIMAGAVLAGRPSLGQPPARPGPAAALPMPMVEIGRNPVSVSPMGLDGWTLGEQMQPGMASQMIRKALDFGISYFDTAPSYGKDGRLERIMGELLSPIRRQVFIASKTAARSAARAEEDLEGSLTRLSTSHIDAWLFHAVSSPEDAERIAAPDGAATAARKALEDGRVRKIGATSLSSPAGLLRLIELVPELEIIECPVNCLDPHWRSFSRQVLEPAGQKQISIAAAKALAEGMAIRIPGVSELEAKRYTLSQPITIWLSGAASLEELERDATLIKTFQPLSEEDQAALLGRTAPFKGAAFEPYKSR